MIQWKLMYFPPINLYSVPIQLWDSKKTMIATPCKKECLYNPDKGWCEECGRTLEDLELWTSIDKGEKFYRMGLAKERLKSDG